MIIALSVRSLRNRRVTALLTVFSIALAVGLLLGVERIRADAEESFASSISGTDLIVGARTGPVNLLLASVFRIGNVTNNIGWQTYRAIAARPDVAWTIPLSLGDSHRGFRVIGTNDDYFERFRFGQDRPLVMAKGRRFNGDDEVVLGAEVARSLRYDIGQEIVIAHGTGEVAFMLHRNHPFHVVGILATTGTPVDRAIHTSLAGIDAMHEKEDDDPLAAAIKATGPAGQSHANDAGHGPSSEDADGHGAAHAISAVLVGLRSRGAALSVQRKIDEFDGEPLTAILPAVTLLDLWEITGAVQKSLFAISLLVVVVGLAGMLIALFAGLNERRREMAVLRAIGARPWHVFALIVGEAATLTIVGIAIGVVVLYSGFALGGPWLEQHLGLFIVQRWPSKTEFGLTMLVALAGILIGLIPAYKSYRMSLADGMTIRT
jgi:putative ABC transport system permease protein